MPHSVARIDLGALGSNIDQVRDVLPRGFGILFPVKADAYGHGLEAIAQTAADCGVDALGVATVDEGARIRRVGVKLPVHLLSPILPGDARAAIELGLTLQVSDLESALHLGRAAREMRAIAHVQVNVDTGMRRFGALPEEALDLMRNATRISSLAIDGVSSHLSVADSETQDDQAFSLSQIARFRALLSTLDHAGLLPRLRHIANSAAVIQYTDEVTAPPLNMARVATLLLGYPEVRRPWTERVHPVATLSTRVIALKNLAKGDSAGYGRAYRAQRQERLAILPIGYGSGYSSQLAHGGTVLVRGRRAPVVGKICLEHTLVNVTRIPGVSVGDEVEVFGPRLPADAAACAAGLEVCQLLVPALRGAQARTYIRSRVTPEKSASPLVSLSATPC